MSPYLYRTVSSFAMLACLAASGAYLSHAEAAPPSPALQITKPIYAWKTEHENDKKTGAFSHCLVKNMYDNGTVVMLAENNDGVQRLALHFPQNKMEPGQHFDLTIQIDKRDLFPVEAVAVSPQILTIGIPEVLPDQMRKGQALYLRGPNDEVVYTLEGVDGAVTSLRDCTMTQKNPTIKKVVSDTQVADATPTPAPAPVKTEKAPEPVPAPKAVEKSKAQAAKTEAKPVEKKTPVVATAAAPQTAQPAAPSAPNRIERFANRLSENLMGTKTIETAEPTLLPGALHGIFAQAGMAPDKLIKKNAASAHEPADYAWLHDGLFVSVKEQKPVPSTGFAKTALHYLSLLKKRCTGSFVAEAAPAMKNKSGMIEWQIAETACSTGKNEDRISALLFTNSAQNTRVYFIEAPAQNGAAAIKARDRLLPFAVK